MDASRRGFLKSLAGLVVIAAMPVAFAKQTYQWVNVKWFGARGDGIIDDSEAFRRAFECVKDGGNIYIPRGKYRI
jgi:polygalacturonase